MTEPCAMGLVMGTHTVSKLEYTDDAAVPKPELLKALDEVDPALATEAERAAGGVTPHSYLNSLDDLSSTSTLGFRIDAGRTVVDNHLAPLPLPAGTTFATLKAEDDVVSAFSTFFQHDAALAAAMLVKVQTVLAALERSPFFERHVFLRTRLLFVYDDEARTTRLELKMMNFAFSYELPADAPDLNHTDQWDGTSESHADGYLTGMRSVERVIKRVCDNLAAKPVA